MKTFDVKHSDIVNFENILEADKNASQCKHYRDENLKFSAHREEGIIDLLNRLTYYPVFDEEGNQIPEKQNLHTKSDDTGRNRFTNRSRELLWRWNIRIALFNGPITRS